MKKKMVGLLLAMIMLLCMVPWEAKATTPEMVYISVSNDCQYVTDINGAPVAYVGVSLEELVTVDLDEYGLSDYWYDADGDDEYELTALHLYIYVHETLMGCDWSDVNVTGSAGSIYFAGGLFGFSDENLRYDYNGAYPAVDGWGLTADQIVLKDGDFLNVAHYTSWAFWGDSITGFHYFTDSEGALAHTYNATANQEFQVGLVRSYSDWNNGGAPAFAPEAGYEVSYGTSYGTSTGTVTSDDDGCVSITFPSAGTWYVWCDGGYGMENPTDIVSAPAFATVTVTAPAPEPVDPIDVYVSIADKGEIVMVKDKITVIDRDASGDFNVDEVLYAAHESGFTGGATEGYSSKMTEYGLAITKLWGDDETGSYGYWLNDASCWSLGDKVVEGDELVAFVYQNTEVWDSYSKFAQGSYTAKAEVAVSVTLEKAGYDPDWNTVFAGHGGAMLKVYDGDFEELSSDNYSVVDNSDGTYLVTVKEIGEYYVVAYDHATPIVPAICEISVGENPDLVPADAVEKLIDEIGTVTLDSEEAITEAKAAYAALTDAQKALVSNYAKLTAAEAEWAELKKTADDKAVAQTVINLIEGIGNVSLESEEAIAEAKAAYVGLTDEQKALVSNYDKLTEAEAEWAELKKTAADEAAAQTVIDLIEEIGTVTLDSEEVIAEAKSAYAELSNVQKALVSNYEKLTAAETTLAQLKKAAADKVAAQEVIDLIEEIGTVTLESEEAITEAKATYAALTDEQKALVSNYEKLTTAEATLAQLKKTAAEKEQEDREAAATADEKIAAIGTVTVHSGKKIQTARNAYDALTDDQKAYVENLSTLTAAEKKLLELYVEAGKADHLAIYKATGKYLGGLGTPGVGSTGGEWMVIGLVRAGFDCPAGYYENVLEYVKENINDKEQLHRAKSTDNSRVILGLTAAGYDVTDVAGHDLLMGLTDMTYLKKQGINGPIWALIAFDCHNYEIPVNPDAADQVTREKLIAYILEKQLEDGGWALSGKVADPDMTGMAIQALAPYVKTNEKVKASVDKAVMTLSEKQLENGGFGSIDGACSESCAQVIVALTALGIDPEKDSRFVKNGISVVDAMCLFAMEEGGFAHIPGGKVNGMATEQSYYALAAYFRFLNEENTLYDMSDVKLQEKDDSEESTEEPTEEPTEKPTEEPTEDPEDEEPGKIEDVTDVNDNAFSGALDVPSAELGDKLLTEEEVKLVEQGEKVSINLVINDINKTISQEEVELIEKHLDDHKVGLHLDITLEKQIGESDAVKITETKGEITITIVVPEDLRNVDKMFERTYKVLRIHEGKVDVLDAEFDEKTGKLSFQTDAFSTYTLIYSDAPVEETPETGDSADMVRMIGLMITGMCAMAVAMITSKKKAY